MYKAPEEFTEEVTSKVKGATARDVSVAIFCYMSVKRMFPPRSAEKKRFTPLVLAKFLKKKKWKLKDLSEKLAVFDGQEKLGEEILKFIK